MPYYFHFLHFFQNNKKWYVEKGRPYTLGICSWGPPGCGKTSFEKALANYLNRHLIVVDFDKIKSKNWIKNNNLTIDNTIKITNNEIVISL